MIIIGTFQHSIELEQTLSMIEQIGISRNQFLVVCMDSDSQGYSSHKQLAVSSYSRGIEVGMAGATAMSVIGTSVGFVMPWGPIICGLIASAVGFCLGFGLYVLIKKPAKQHVKRKPEVTVIVQCHSEQSDHIRNVMWTNHALSIGISQASAE